MKTVLLNDILSDEELFFLYNEVTRTSCWSVCTTSDVRKYASNTNFSGGAMLCAMNSDEEIINYPLYLYGQTLVYRIAKLLEKKNIGVHTKLKRMWFVSTPTAVSYTHLTLPTIYSV